jgi:hypothetical protein
MMRRLRAWFNGLSRDELELLGSMGTALLLLILAAVGFYSQYRSYAELRAYGQPLQGTWISQRYTDRGDDGDLYEATFEFWLDDQYYQVTQEGRDAYDLFGGPGEPVNILYSIRDPQQARVEGTLNPLPPWHVWLMLGFGLLILGLGLREIRKKRRAT